MRAPGPPITPVEHIVNLIRAAAAPDGDNPIYQFDPFAGGPAIEIASSEIVSYGNTAATAWLVRCAVNFLRDTFAIKDGKSPWGTQQQNKNAIAEVSKRLDDLQRSLEKLPGAIRYLLHSTSIPDLTKLASRGEMEDIFRVMTRFQNFTAKLKMLRDRCGELLNAPPGERANTNYRNKLVAGCAADLLDYYGIEPTRGNDAQPSLYEQIAESLFEAATGEVGGGLRHACREVLEDWKPGGYFFSNFNESEGLS